MNARLWAVLCFTAGCLDLGTPPADSQDAGPSASDLQRLPGDAEATPSDAVTPRSDGDAPRSDARVSGGAACRLDQPIPRKSNAQTTDYLAGFQDLTPLGNGVPNHAGRAMADFDCDGRQDLVLTRRGDSAWTLLFGAVHDASGLPIAETYLRVELPEGERATAAAGLDLELDGVPEVVLLTHNASASTLKLLVYRLDPSEGGFDTNGGPRIANISSVWAGAPVPNPSSQPGPWSLSIVRPGMGSGPWLVLVASDRVALVPVPVSDTPEAWGVTPERISPSTEGVTWQWATTRPADHGATDLVIVAANLQTEAYRFGGAVSGWQRVGRDEGAHPSVRRAFVPLQADADPEPEIVAAFQHEPQLNAAVATVLDPIPLAEGGVETPFARRPVSAPSVGESPGVWAADSAWTSLAVLDVGDRSPSLLLGGLDPQVGARGVLWLLPKLVRSEDGFTPSLRALRNSLASIPDALFWGDFSGDGEPEVVVLDDRKGLVCLRVDVGSLERGGQFMACRR